jgi:hypothetical protein
MTYLCPDPCMEFLGKRFAQLILKPSGNVKKTFFSLSPTLLKNKLETFLDFFFKLIQYFKVKIERLLTLQNGRRGCQHNANQHNGIKHELLSITVRDVLSIAMPFVYTEHTCQVACGLHYKSFTIVNLQSSITFLF